MTGRHVSRRMLVPLDGSDLGSVTIPHLRALAHVETELLLLRVMEDAAPLVGVPDEVVAAHGAARRRGLAACHADLTCIAQELRDVSPYIEPIACVGAPADEIVRVATEREADLILMTMHDREEPERYLVESVAHRVAQVAPMPVMMVHENDLGTRKGAGAVVQYRRVVVPLDDSDHSCAAMPVAVTLANRQGVPMLLVRAIPPREATFACGTSAAAASAGPHRDEWYGIWRESVAQALLVEARRLRATGLEVEAEVLTGTPVEAVLAAVEPGDVIVMASHSAGGVRSWLLGSTTQKMASLAATPVIVVPVEERHELAGVVPVREPATARR